MANFLLKRQFFSKISKVYIVNSFGFKELNGMIVQGKNQLTPLEKKIIYFPERARIENGNI